MINPKVTAQNTGTVSFNVTTNRTFQNYDPRNIMAIWITDSLDNFVQTLKKRANNREQYLFKWIANSNHNIINAITGSTLSSHQTHNLSWNCQDIAGNTVADGWYRIRCEYTTRNGQGPWTPIDYIQFYKGSNAIDTTFSNFSYNSQIAFSNISLIYMPDATGVWEEDNSALITDFNLSQNYPNPFNPETTIKFSVSDKNRINSQIQIFNIVGQLVRSFDISNISLGEFSITWDGKDNNNIDQPSGVYYYQLSSGSFQQTRKMILVR